MATKKDWRGDPVEPIENLPPHARGAMPTKIIRCSDPPFDRVFVAYNLETDDAAVILTRALRPSLKGEDTRK